MNISNECYTNSNDSLETDNDISEKLIQFIHLFDSLEESDINERSLKDIKDLYDKLDKEDKLAANEIIDEQTNNYKNNQNIIKVYETLSIPLKNLNKESLEESNDSETESLDIEFEEEEDQEEAKDNNDYYCNNYIKLDKNYKKKINDRIKKIKELYTKITSEENDNNELFKAAKEEALQEVKAINFSREQKKASSNLELTDEIIYRIFNDKISHLKNEFDKECQEFLKDLENLRNSVKCLKKINENIRQINNIERFNNKPLMTIIEDENYIQDLDKELYDSFKSGKILKAITAYRRTINEIKRFNNE